MDGGRLLRLILMLVVALGMMNAGGQSAFAAAGDCSTQELQNGTCSVVGGGSDVVIEVGDTSSGPGGGTTGGGGTGTGGTGTADAEVECFGGIRECYDVTSDDPAGPVTIRDIAAFRPTPEIDHMEPNGWMVVGLDTNFYATGGVRTVSGQLLGASAKVRFHPAAWTWNYGDGATRTSATRGGPWATLRIPEFDQTGTSHVYRTAGEYTIRLSVTYYAEYQYAGSPWYPVIGTLAVPANPLVATAGSADTVLVEEECTRNPDGPGC